MKTQSNPSVSIVDIMAKAATAANLAGQAWLDNAKPKFAVVDSHPLTGQNGRSHGAALDVCGNAHAVIKNKRSKAYKSLQQAGFISCGRVDVRHQFKARPEYDLKLACANAAIEVLIAHGYAAELWEYMD